MQPVVRPDQSQASINPPLPFIAETETGRIKEAVEGGIIQAGRIIGQNAKSFRGYLDGDTAERRMMAVPLGQLLNHVPHRLLNAGVKRVVMPAFSLAGFAARGLRRAAAIDHQDQWERCR